jgi:hypothetical protein
VDTVHAGIVDGADVLARVYSGSDLVASRPIKVHCAKDPGFTLIRKSEMIPDLLLAYVWIAQPESPELHALSYAEAFRLLDSRKHTKTDSWLVDGRYSLRVGSSWRERLAPYRMQPRDWASKIVGR